jgi:hypothetical protein
MTLDELLKQNATWLDQALKRPVFDKVDDRTVKLPEDLRQRRITALSSRIDDLTKRKAAADAAYDQAIAREKAELEGLQAQKPATTPP